MFEHFHLSVDHINDVDYVVASCDQCTWDTDDDGEGCTLTELVTVCVKHWNLNHMADAS